MPATMIEVESSQILRIGHDPEKGCVRVEFKSHKTGAVSAVWEYGNEEHPFTAEDFEKFKAAESVGRFFGAYVKNVFPSNCISKS